jgi:diacylglycerol kinase family enzyme
VRTPFSLPHFIVNPRSAQADTMRRVDAIHDEACRRFPDPTWMATSSPGDGVELARAAALSGADLVVAVGGDGTINEVVNGLMDAGESAGPVRCWGFCPWAAARISFERCEFLAIFDRPWTC